MNKTVTTKMVIQGMMQYFLQLNMFYIQTLLNTDSQSLYSVVSLFIFSC